jgi:hypothetical protein
MSLLAIETPGTAILAAILFLGGLGASLLVAVRKYESTWYRARAIAESIKTGTWRYAMGTEPFDLTLSSEEAKRKLVDLMQKILSEHKDLAADLSESADQEAITTYMTELRRFPLDKRLATYRTERIDDQRTWYSKKATWNKKQGQFWFAVMVLLQIAAIVLCLFRVYLPEFKYWPIEVFAVAAGAVLTWIQVKRFRELAAAYSVAAHEIGLISSGLGNIKNNEEFSRFVQDSENAFSREHTQWVARKDY